MAIEKATVGTSNLWQQWQQKHRPETIRLLPATRENEYFDTQHVNPDDRHEYRKDRQRWVANGKECFDTTPQAEREANWITRYERGDSRYQARLTDAGYSL